MLQIISFTASETAAPICSITFQFFVDISTPIMRSVPTGALSDLPDHKMDWEGNPKAQKSEQNTK